ncbi:adhesin [Halopseudomonas pertucinogena]|uniref:Adhesin n=1 Tax=Halopseudomonas pertucinogena TaxID=86175 RepID=A0ABQ2CNH3_9GAMM|nr:adhesin [Halopseudomonas pertucinogena]GGI95411.1 hypothetical protein GCM10009083_09920 [Halopseudomonas pertucinogena]
MGLRHLLIICSLLCCLPAMADNAVIDSSGAGYQGNLMLNQAAGDAHQQANARAVAPGDMPRINVRQERDGVPAARGTSAIQASIQGDAFSGGSGVLGVNQSAGAANQQINGFRIGAGVRPESLDDSSLAQAAALSPQNSAEPPLTGDRRVEIDDRAFSDSRGVVQLNQAAGVGNRMVNNLGIRILE